MSYHGTLADYAFLESFHFIITTGSSSWQALRSSDLETTVLSCDDWQQHTGSRLSRSRKVSLANLLVSINYLVSAACVSLPCLCGLQDSFRSENGLSLSSPSFLSHLKVTGSEMGHGQRQLTCRCYSGRGVLMRILYINTLLCVAHQARCGQICHLPIVFEKLSWS